MVNWEDCVVVLSEISCLVLFIVGGEDIVVLFEVSCKQFVFLVVVEIYVLEKVGYMGMIEVSC